MRLRSPSYGWDARAIHPCKAATVRIGVRGVGASRLELFEQRPEAHHQRSHHRIARTAGFNASTICALPAARSGRGVVSKAAAICGGDLALRGSVRTGAVSMTRRGPIDAGCRRFVAAIRRTHCCANTARPGDGFPVGRPSSCVALYLLPRAEMLMWQHGCLSLWQLATAGDISERCQPSGTGDPWCESRAQDTRESLGPVADPVGLFRRTGDTNTRPHWSTREMAKAVGLSHMAVSRMWHAFGLQPHRSETFKLSTEPLLVENVRDIVGLYVNPPAHAAVFCVDEKPQIQALDRTQPLLPMQPGQVERRTHDYKRHGTTTLFAALNAKTSEVITQFHQRHRSAQFREFLDFISDIEEQPLRSGSRHRGLQYNESLGIGQERQERNDGPREHSGITRLRKAVDTFDENGERVRARSVHEIQHRRESRQRPHDLQRIIHRDRSLGLIFVPKKFTDGLQIPADLVREKPPAPSI